MRYFNVFGLRQDPNSQYSAVSPRFIKGMLKGDSPIIFGVGEQSRDFTYIWIVVSANLLASTEPDVVGKALNCATHGQITLNTLVMQLNRSLGTVLKDTYAPSRLGDIRHSYADIGLLQVSMGYLPIMNFNDGLGRQQNTIAANSNARLTPVRIP